MYIIQGLVIFFGMGVYAEHQNFCKPLEDYSPREDRMETRHVCKTEMNKKCEEVLETGCLDITELRCDVLLTTNCSMNWTNKDKIESVMSVKEIPLKNCTKEMVREFHNKTIYECKNVTKVHCTTLWTIDESGEKIWAGNEDDCRDVTWEECFPISKQVPMMVAQMTCAELPVSYFDYENITTQAMADTMDCEVNKVPVCSPITTTKCDDVTYTKCQEVPETVCTTVEIPVPAQSVLHKQWCLFDQEENIDFNRQVRKINQLANNDVEDENQAVLTSADQAAVTSADQAAVTSADQAAATSADQTTDTSADKIGSIVAKLDPIFTDFSLLDVVDSEQPPVKRNQPSYNKKKARAVRKPRY